MTREGARDARLAIVRQFPGRQGAACGRAWGAVAPLPRGRACRPRHGEAAGSDARASSEEEASRAARKEASRAARKEASRAARSRAARGTLTRTRTRTRTRTPKSTPSLSRTRPRPRRRSRLGVLRRRRRESRARGCFADAAGSTRGDVQVLLPKPHPHLARGCASLPRRPSGDAGSDERRVDATATGDAPSAVAVPPRPASSPPRAGKKPSYLQRLFGYPPPRLRPRARGFARGTGTPPKRPNLPPRRRWRARRGRLGGLARLGGSHRREVPVPATRRWRR